MSSSDCNEQLVRLAREETSKEREEALAFISCISTAEPETQERIGLAELQCPEHPETQDASPEPAKKKQKKQTKRIRIKIHRNNILVFSALFDQHTTCREIISRIPVRSKAEFFLTWNDGKIYPETTLAMLGVRSGDVLDLQKIQESKPATSPKQIYKDSLISFTLRTPAATHQETFDIDSYSQCILDYVNKTEQKTYTTILFDGEAVVLQKTIEEGGLENEDLLDIE